VGGVAAELAELAHGDGGAERPAAAAATVEGFARLLFDSEDLLSYYGPVPARGGGGVMCGGLLN
jgi:hypothetical protein